ncbi:MAG: hypothetical protein ACI93V_000864, partial [Alteromonadaceae bacterium]
MYSLEFAPSFISEAIKSEAIKSKVLPIKGNVMKINLSGHHVEVNDSIQADIEEKFSKIANHFPTLIAL